MSTSARLHAYHQDHTQRIQQQRHIQPKQEEHEYRYIPENDTQEDASQQEMSYTSSQYDTMRRPTSSQHDMSRIASSQQLTPRQRTRQPHRDIANSIRIYTHVSARPRAALSTHGMIAPRDMLLSADDATYVHPDTAYRPHQQRHVQMKPSVGGRDARKHVKQVTHVCAVTRDM